MMMEAMEAHHPATTCTHEGREGPFVIVFAVRKIRSAQ